MTTIFFSHPKIVIDTSNYLQASQLCPRKVEFVNDTSKCFQSVQSSCKIIEIVIDISKSVQASDQFHVKTFISSG